VVLNYAWGKVIFYFARVLTYYSESVFKILISGNKARYLIFKSQLHNFSMLESGGTLPRINVAIRSNT
jgi:hypothetical protein